jgi:hypothetical protein
VATAYRGGVPPDAYLEAADESRPALFTATVVAVVAVLIAGLVSVAALGTSLVNSPRDAVDALITGLETHDTGAVLATLDPAERAAIAPGLSQITASLKRIGVLSDSADPNALSGLSAAFHHVTTRTVSLAALHPGLAEVQFTGGTATLSLDPGGLPLGALVQGVVAAAFPHPFRRSFALREPIVTIQRNGTWYVSLGYTLAENARRRARLPLPTAAQAVPAVGAASPEGAARAFLTAAAGGDLRGLVEVIDPVVGGPFHDYAGLFAGQVRSPVALRSIGLRTTSVSGGVLVTVTSLDASVGRDEVTLAGRCFRVGRRAPLCEPSGSNLLAGYGVVAVERPGGWFVDPYRTVFDDLARVSAGLDLADLARLARDGGPLAAVHSVLAFVAQAPGLAAA